MSTLLSNAASMPEATQDRLWRDINNMLEREARAEENQRPDGFVLMRVPERLIALATHLSERADMAIAYGPAGIGKTTTIKAIAAEISTAIAITAGYDTRTPKKLLRVIYAAVASRRKRGKADLFVEEVIEKLRMPEKVKTRSLLIIDQAHLLLHSAGIWQLLMELHDRAQCSILLVGTRDLQLHVATDDDPEFGQLSSRVGMRIELAPELVGSLRGGAKRGAKRCFSVADIRKLFAGSKLKLHPDAAQMLCEIANTRRGTLRRVKRLFDWAEVAAREAGAGTITTQHLQSAAALVEEDAELPSGLEDGREVGAVVAAG